MPLALKWYIHFCMFLTAGNKNYSTFHFASFPSYLHFVIVQSFLYFSPAPASLYSLVLNHAYVYIFSVNI